MSLRKSLLAVLKETPLAKAEDPKAYAKLASVGTLLGHPVKIKGQDTRSDNNIKYHSTIKFFDPEKDKPDDIHGIASKLEHQNIDPKHVGIEPHVIKDRMGNDIYALKLHGPHADKLKEHHDKFSHMGHKENYEFAPHISVPKAVHDEIKSKGHKTAHEAGIEFGHAELKQGPKTLAAYKPKAKASDKLAASEKISDEIKEVPTDETPLMKPYRSEAQRRWAHTAAGKKALGGNAGVHEWDEATKGKKLPEKIAKSESESPPSKLNLEKGAKDISSKTLAQIQEDTAWTWASRAAACYEKLKETGDWKWKTDAEEYRHEAVEHAALIGDTRPTVLQEIHDALEKYRTKAQKEAEAMNKSEKVKKLCGEDLRRYIEDNPEFKDSINKRK
jgi:hypothetical protein